jgi:hypothetical protein
MIRKSIASPADYNDEPWGLKSREKRLRPGFTFFSRRINMAVRRPGKTRRGSSFVSLQIVYEVTSWSKNSAWAPPRIFISEGKLIERV